MTGWLTQQWPLLNNIRDYDFTNFWGELEDAMKAYAPFHNDTRLDLEPWLKEHGIPILSKKLEDAKTTFEIECQGTHGDYPKDDGKAFVIQFADGGLSYGCHHSSCSHYKELGNHWRGLRAIYEPKAGRANAVRAAYRAETQTADEEVRLTEERLAQEFEFRYKDKLLYDHQRARPAGFSGIAVKVEYQPDPRTGEREE